jgi:hypothetical protein
MQFAFKSPLAQHPKGIAGAANHVLGSRSDTSNLAGVDDPLVPHIYEYPIGRRWVTHAGALRSHHVEHSQPGRDFHHQCGSCARMQRTKWLIRLVRKSESKLAAELEPQRRHYSAISNDWRQGGMKMVIVALALGRDDNG